MTQQQIPNEAIDRENPQLAKYKHTIFVRRATCIDVSDEWEWTIGIGYEEDERGRANIAEPASVYLTYRDPIGGGESMVLHMDRGVLEWIMRHGEYLRQKLKQTEEARGSDLGWLYEEKTFEW